MGTISAIGSVAGLIATITAKKPSVSIQGSPTQFRIDLNAPIPYMVGRTQHAGYIVHRDYYGSKNAYQSFVSVISGGGPIQEIETFQVDRTTTTFSGGNAVGFYHDWMWLSTQLGTTPQASALSSPIAGFPNWGAASRLSGNAAYLWTLKYDTKGKKYTAGVPQPGVVAKGVKVYDPRLDSTYPGGSGSHRSNNEATWTYSENPWLHALTWVIGRHQNGKRVLGVGVPIEGIDVGAFVDAANVADLNGWKIGGVVYSTDDKWNVLKQMAQAGGGEPIRNGALVSCAVNAPRVSLDTVTIHDLIGEGAAPGTRVRRERINGIVPRYRSEAHGWEVIPASEVRVAAYVTADGSPRTKEVEYPLVQQLAQVAQLAAYDIVNAREFGPITLPLKIRWMGYKPGDCITLDLPDMNLNGQTAIVIGRQLDPQSGVVTLTLKSETAAKHDYALGKTTTAPPTPSLTPPDLSDVAAPELGAWSITGTGLTAAGVTFPALIVEGASDNPNSDAVIVEYRVYAGGLGDDDNWIGAGTLPPETIRHEISSVTGDTEYQVSIRYRVRGVIGARRILGPVTTDNAAGIGGTPGADGRNVAQVMIFRRAASTPALPSADTNFNFVTGALTGLTNGWTKDIPAGTDPLYASLATASNVSLTDTITPGEWASPVVLVTDSVDGLNAATVFLWQRNNTGVAPAAPSTTLTYTFATGVLSGTLGSWSQSVPDAVGGKYLFVTTASAIADTATDTIAAGEWAPVERHARDGEDGVNGLNNAPVMIYQRASSTPTLPSATTTYTFATKALTGLNNGWSTTIPAGSAPLYVSTAVASSNTATDTIAAGEWSAPTIMVQDGAPGTERYTWIAYSDSADGSVNFTNGAPGDRKFIGIAANKTTATESATPSDYTWSQYAGPPGFGLVNHAGMNIAGNKITKISGAAVAFDASVYSSEAWIGGAYISWKAAQTDKTVFVGLGSDPTTGVSYVSIDYAWYAYNDGTAHIFEEGADLGAFGSYTPDTVLANHYDGANVRYYMDGVLKRTVAAPAGLKLYLDSSFGVLGGSATILGFGPSGAAGADGLSIAELTVYRRATSTPATPTGGSYNFATKVLTAPSGWSATIPAGNDPLYAATGAAAVQGTTGIATPTWAGVGLLAQEGAGTNLIFRRSATAPATPGASSGVPSGWYDSTGSVPAGADPIWASFGARPNAGANWTWQTPKKVEGEDGVSPVSIAISPNTATVQLAKDGTVKSGQLPLNFVVTAMQGGNAIALTSLTINASSGGTWSEDDTKITLSALSDVNAEVQFTAVAGGQSVVGVIAVSTAQDGAGGASTSLDTAASLTIANQTSYTQVGGTVAINVSSAGKLKVNFSGMLKPTTVEGYQWQSKIQYSLTGGSSWVDVSGSARDSSPTFELGVPPYGMRGGTLSSASPITVTGLTADAPALVRALVQRKSGSATASGTMSGTLTLYAEQVL